MRKDRFSVQFHFSLIKYNGKIILKGEMKMNENLILTEAIAALKKASDADERGFVLRQFSERLAQPDYAKLVALVLR